MTSFSPKPPADGFKPIEAGEPAEATVVRHWQVGHSDTGYILIHLPKLGTCAMGKEDAKQFAADIVARLAKLEN